MVLDKHKKVIFGVILPIISIICSALSIQFDLLFPLPSYLTSDIEVFDCSVEFPPKEKERMTYIFVLDTSKSYQSQKIKPGWFNSQAKDIDDFLAGPKIYPGNTNSQSIPLFLLCKVKLSQAILEFMREDADFEIWTLGSEAVSHHSGKFGGSISTRNSVKEAIKKIIDMPQDALNTDFISLFERLLKNHDYLIQTNPDEYKLPRVALILVSDLLHDIKEKSGLNQYESQLDDQRTLLTRKINEISRTDILVEVIEIPCKKNREHEIPVWDLLNDNKFLVYRLKKMSIKNKGIEPLFPTIKSQKSITFYYNYGFKPLKSSVYLKFNKDGDYSIGLNSEKDYNYNSNKNLNFKVVHINKNGEELISRKERLIAGGVFVELPNLKTYEYVALTYDGYLPSNGIFPDIRLSFLEEAKINYSIPIKFKKEPIPSEAIFKISMIITSTLIFFYFIFLLLYMLYSKVGLFLKVKKKHQSMEKIEKKSRVNIPAIAISKNDSIKCPYSDCPDDYHDANSAFCPNTGKPLLVVVKSKKNFVIIVLVIVISVLSINYFLLISGKSNSSANISPRDNDIVKVPPSSQKSSKIGEQPKIKEEKKIDLEIEKEYKACLKRAREYYNKGDYKKALASINKAKELKNIKGIVDLELKIREKPGPPVEKVGKVKEDEKDNVKIVNFSELPTKIKNKYNKKMEKIQDINFSEIDKIINQTIHLELSVDEKGKIIVEKVFQIGISVSPEILERAKRSIQKKIEQIPFSILPTDEKGNPMKVVNWELEFKVIKYNERMTIRRE
jgi:hypothetical protein